MAKRSVVTAVRENFEESLEEAKKGRAVAERELAYWQNQLASYPKQPKWYQWGLKWAISGSKSEISLKLDEIAQANQRISGYQGALKGIDQGDYEPAIKQLEIIIPRLRERAEFEPDGVLFGSASAAATTEEWKNELIHLSSK